MNKQDDFLANIEIQNENIGNKETLSEQSESIAESCDLGEDNTEQIPNHTSLLSRVKNGTIFLIKYTATSAGIFAALLLISNYSAYWNLAKSVIYAEELKQNKQSLIDSVAAAEIKDEQEEETNQGAETFRNLQQKEESKTIEESIHDISGYKASSGKNIDLGIEITPYENRIVIPKIGKNIPLVDIKQKKVSGVDELNDIFMKELENGVIRYPGSAKPGENGNAFIFGHSSNFPWLEGDYNDVFALLDKVVFDDEIIVYYGQEKYTYKIRTKDVIRPGDVSVLESNENDSRAQITLMTCWPIGTTLNRLVLTGELVSIEK